MAKQVSHSNLVRVRDAFVRTGHWVLVVAYFTAYFTEDHLLSVHVRAGYVVGAIVVARVAWGFMGHHARSLPGCFSCAAWALTIQLKVGLLPWCFPRRTANWRA